MFVLCIPSDETILRPSCVVSYSTVEKAENSPRTPRRSMATRERPNRADKNGAIIVPTLVSPFVPHRTLRHTHRIIRSPIATTTAAWPHHAIPPASRQPRIVPPQRHPTRATGRTRIEQQQRREKTRRTETSEASERTRADKNGAHRNRHTCLRIG